MYYMLLQKGKKSGVTVGAGSNGQAVACGRLASVGGATGTVVAVGTGSNYYLVFI